MNTILQSIDEIWTLQRAFDLEPSLDAAIRILVAAVRTNSLQLIRKKEKEILPAFGYRSGNPLTINASVFFAYPPEIQRTIASLPSLTLHFEDPINISPDPQTTLFPQIKSVWFGMLSNAEIDRILQYFPRLNEVTLDVDEIEGQNTMEVNGLHVERDINSILLESLLGLPHLKKLILYAGTCYGHSKIIRFPKELLQRLTHLVSNGNIHAPDFFQDVCDVTSIQSLEVEERNCDLDDHEEEPAVLRALEAMDRPQTSITALKIDSRYMNMHKKWTYSTETDEKGYPMVYGWHEKHLKFLRFFPRLQNFSAYGFAFNTGVGLRYLQQLAELRSITLSSVAKIGVRAWQTLSKLQKIEEIHLELNEDVSYIFKDYERNIDTSGIRFFSSHPTLRTLLIDNLIFTKDFFYHLSTLVDCPRLSLELTGCLDLNDIPLLEVKTLISKLPSFRRLQFNIYSGCSTDEIEDIATHFKTSRPEIVIQD